MKKLLLLLLAMVLPCMLLCSCGNMSLGIGNYTFKKAHINFGNYDGCVKVEKWYDNEFGCEIKTPDGALYLSEGTYVLIEDNCPICDAAAR